MGVMMISNKNLPINSIDRPHLEPDLIHQVRKSTFPSSTRTTSSTLSSINTMKMAEKTSLIAITMTKARQLSNKSCNLCKSKNCNSLRMSDLSDKEVATTTTAAIKTSQ